MRRPRPLTWSDRHALIATIRRLPERPGRVAREIGIVDGGCGSTPGRRQSGAIPPLFPIPLFRSRSITWRGNGAASQVLSVIAAPGSWGWPMGRPVHVRRAIIVCCALLLLPLLSVTVLEGAAG